MSYHSQKEKIIEWNTAIDSFNCHRMEDALDIFCRIADMSKLHFNIGVCCCNLFDYERAELAFSKALEADAYLAIAYYQRGWIYTQLKQYSKALKDYIQAYQSLRKNLYINYSQIGLHFQLNAGDIVMNAGLCTVLLRDVSKAKLHFKKGLQISDPEDKKNFEKALELGEKAPKAIPFRYAPLSVIFEPQSDQISSVHDVNYLGSSTVISETKKDDFSDMGEDFLFDFVSEPASSPKTFTSLSSKSPLSPLVSNLPTAAPLSPLGSHFQQGRLLSPSGSHVATRNSPATSNPPLPPRSPGSTLNSHVPPRSPLRNSNPNLPPRTRERSDTAPLNRNNSAPRPSSNAGLRPRTQSLSKRNTGGEGNDLVVIRLFYGSKHCIMTVNRDIEFRDLALQIQNAFDLNITFKVSYKDSYGDTVIITDEEDFKLCVYIWKGMNRGREIKLYVID